MTCPICEKLTEEIARTDIEVDALKKERSQLMGALENCGLLARKNFNKHDDWKHINRFCKEVGVKGSVLRAESIREKGE